MGKCFLRSIYLITKAYPKRIHLRSEIGFEKDNQRRKSIDPIYSIGEDSTISKSSKHS